MSTKRLLNFSELAKYLGVSRPCLRKLIADNKFTVKPIVQYAERSKTQPNYWSTVEVDKWLENESN